ncbi:MAG: glutamate 5-kinase [Clostridia bacterium]|nr:glutamate 5-kinase [Clostridia bacterium]
MALYENRIVVKIGTSTLMNGLGKSDLENTEKIVRILSDISNLGFRIIIVSSGAIALGSGRMKFAGKPPSRLALRQKQAAAAVGQCALLFMYDHFFGFYGKTIAQILLSAEDIGQENKKDNLTKTFDTLLEEDIIPVVNANDSVNVEEIMTSDEKFGDNDMLSAAVAVLCRASKLILLSDIDAVYENHPGTGAPEPVDDVTEIMDNTAYIASRVDGKGMHEIGTKIEAARYASLAGTDTYIMNGRTPEKLYDIIKGIPAGTRFAGKNNKQENEP